MEITKDTAAIVTGGASGLGEATVRALVAKGAKVAVFDMNEERGNAIAEELGVTFCNVNVTSEESVVAGFEKARAANGQERIVVNCAGTGAAMKTQSKGVPHDIKIFDLICQINLIGTFRVLSKAAAEISKLEPVNDSGERGVIINTASVAAFDGQIGQASYSASKGGVVGMTLPIARDLSRDGIRCCTIAPGIFETPLLAGAPDNVKQALEASVPFPSRLGRPTEYASLAVQIMENTMLNGETIRLDGAIRMAPR